MKEECDYFCRKSDLVIEKEKIEIKPGWKKETKITFPGKGDQMVGEAPGSRLRCG